MLDLIETIGYFVAGGILLIAGLFARYVYRKIR